MSIYMTVYQCICMHEYIYVCTHVCIVCVYMFVHASMCRCMYVYMYACVHTCMYVCNFKVGFLSSMGGGIVLVGREIVRWGIVRGIVRGNCPGECPFPVLNSCILYGVLYIGWYCVLNSCILYGILCIARYCVWNSFILYGILCIAGYCVWNSCILYGILTPGTLFLEPFMEPCSTAVKTVYQPNYICQRSSLVFLFVWTYIL